MALSLETKQTEWQPRVTAKLQSAVNCKCLTALLHFKVDQTNELQQDLGAGQLTKCHLLITIKVLNQMHGDSYLQDQQEFDNSNNLQVCSGKLRGFHYPEWLSEKKMTLRPIFQNLNG